MTDEEFKAKLKSHGPLYSERTYIQRIKDIAERGMKEPEGLSRAEAEELAIYALSQQGQVA